MAENGNNKAGEALLAKGRRVYGIGGKHVFASNYYPETETVVIVTSGGKRVRYRDGDEKSEDFCKLTEIEVTGVNPAAGKRKPITGKKK